MANKLYMIGNAHLDPVWLWRWQEGYSEILATFRSALDRMNDFPDFKFTSACAGYYEFVEKLDPDMFEEIKRRVKEGRWGVVGGMYVQPDCNMPDGESFARHFLISQRYFKEKFGVVAKTGYNVDSFGHNAGLPKIMKSCGMENYVFMRPSPDEQGRDESLFNWESDDGSKVCAYRVPVYYNYYDDCIKAFKDFHKKAQDEKTDLMAFYGVGNHGGGPTIKQIHDINNSGIQDMLYATPDDYFDNVDKSNLPTIKGDLQHHARGCYSALTYVKKSNRKCEQSLLATEKICTMASKLTGYKYLVKKLQKAWKNLLFNQFHDILCGCSIKKAYEDASFLFGEIMSITEQERYFAMQSIARKIDTLQGETLPSYKLPNVWKCWTHEVLGTPIVVFNPHGWAVKSVVEVNPVAKKMTDCNGAEIPFQIVRGDQTNGDKDKSHTVFVAEVPAMGYAVYRLFTEKESEKRIESELTISNRTLENSKIAVEFDKTTGDVKRFYDKASGQYLISEPCSAILLDETDCDTWAHDKTYLGEKVGMFKKPRFKIIENGPIRATLRVTTSYGKSTLTRDYTITPSDSRVSVKTKVDFHEKHKTLKFTFPMQNETVISKVAYGTIEKKGYLGEEPCGSWIASGKVVVANDSKYGYDTKDGQIRLTILRGAIYADHYGERDEFCEYMDQGEHEFTYCIFPYTSNSVAEKKASELNFALPYVQDCFHDGKLPQSFSGFTVNADNVILSCVKQSYDGDGTVVRLYEMDGKQSDVTLQLFDNKIEKRVRPKSINTLLENGKEVNLIEL